MHRLQTILGFLLVFFTVSLHGQAPDTLNWGTTANDGTGDNLRSGGIKINAWDRYLSQRVDSLQVGDVRTATASDSIDLTDHKVYMNVGTANNLTVVANSIKAFPVETEITVINWGAGKTTIVAGAGVTINSAGAALDLRAQYSAATLIKKETDIWWLVGDIE